ncbi:MAG: four helix bundle protein [Candidatus Omnitrophica bacterium]|nr:four helix bundle protein [Candidatus Omnitrophota bacterium]
MFSINDRHHFRFNTRLRTEMLDVWKEAVDFVNRVNVVVVRFPDVTKRDLKHKVITTSVRIADLVARSSESRSPQALESGLREAIAAVHETMAQLYIAKQWNYLAHSYYQELFEEGRGMVQKLCLFGGFTYAEQDHN